jgi:hypothetical protein
MRMLLGRQRMSEVTDVLLSIVMAVQHATRVPMLLVRDESGISLKTWKEHEGQPLVVGRNVYDRLLRSVVYGTADFPLPREVLESLPLNYLVPAGDDDVLKPLVVLSNYAPAQVRYDLKTKGVFVVCQPTAKSADRTLSGISLLPFPEELADVSYIDFGLASCLNAGNTAVQLWLSLVDQIVARAGQDKSDVLEKIAAKFLSQPTSMRGRHGEVKAAKEEALHAISRRFASQVGVDITVPDAAVEALWSARTVGDYLWEWRPA